MAGAWYLLSHVSRTVAMIVIASGALGIAFLFARKLIRLLRASFAGRWAYPAHSFTPKEWTRVLARSRPRAQDRQLRATAPDSLNLTLSQFLRLLEHVEPLVSRDPALSTYWDRRDQLEQALRQDVPTEPPPPPVAS